jgi:hypothetical protein
MERAYAAMLAAAGLSMVLMNVLNGETVKTVKAGRILLARGIFSWEEIP